MINNRGMLPSTLLIVEIIIIAVFALMLGSVVQKYSNPLFASQLIGAEDIARTIDTAQSIPYDMHYIYPESIEGFTVNLTKNSVILEPNNNLEETDAFSKKRGFFVRSDIKIIESNNIGVSYFFVDKKGNEISIGGQSSRKNDVLNNINKDKPSLQITFDVPKKLTDKTSLTKLTDSLKATLKKEDFNIVENGELVLTFKIVDDKENTDNTIYYSSSQSYETKPLAENLLKELGSRMKFNSLVLSKDNNKKTIEIDFINTPDNLDKLNNDRTIIADQITGIIKNYYRGSK